MVKSNTFETLRAALKGYIEQTLAERSPQSRLVTDAAGFILLEYRKRQPDGTWGPWECSQCGETGYRIRQRPGE